MADLTITDIRERIRRLERWHYGPSGQVETPKEFSGLPETDENGNLITTTEYGDTYTFTPDEEGGGRTLTFNIPTTTLAAGDNIRQRFHVPDGESYTVSAVECQDAANTSPADLTVSVENETDAVTVHTSGEKHDAGDLGTIDGPADAAVVIDNATGGEVDASGAAHVEDR